MKATDPLQRLQEQITNTLKPFGFEFESDWDWSRDVRWKMDIIHVELRKALRKEFLICLRVRIPSLHKEGTEDWPFQYLAHDNSARIMGRQPTYTRLPAFWGFAPRFLRSLSRELEGGVAWFEKFSTPKKCLRELDSLVAPGSLAHGNAGAYLRSLLVE
jgi:hypothetical protein